MGRGRKKLVDLGKLLFNENAWTQTFLGLRDGQNETEANIPGGYGSAMLLKSIGEHKETLNIRQPGKQAIEYSVDKTVSKGQEFRPAKRQQAEARMQRAEKEFEDMETGEKTQNVILAAIPAERNLWESLKRARSAAQVRRICRRSKYWLKFEWSGEWNGRAWNFQTPSPYPRALYDHAEKFCQAKLGKRYPSGGKQDRRSSDDKRVEYLARVMAGLSLYPPIAPATAVNLLRKTKHKPGCPCYRCTVWAQAKTRKRS